MRVINTSAAWGTPEKLVMNPELSMRLNSALPDTPSRKMHSKQLVAGDVPLDKQSITVNKRNKFSKRGSKKSRWKPYGQVSRKDVASKEVAEDPSSGKVAYRRSRRLMKPFNLRPSAPLNTSQFIMNEHVTGNSPQLNDIFHSATPDTRDYGFDEYVSDLQKTEDSTVEANLSMEDELMTPSESTDRASILALDKDALVALVEEKNRVIIALRREMKRLRRDSGS